MWKDSLGNTSRINCHLSILLMYKLWSEDAGPWCLMPKFDLVAA